MKNVIVVAGKDIRKHGVKLVHILSKMPEVKSSLFTPKQFSNNESQKTGRNYVIFLGKNSAADPYIELIEKKETELGMAWGYDGPKAAIYLTELVMDIDKLKKENEKIHTALAVSGIAAFPLLLALFNPVYSIGGIIVFIKKVINQKKQAISLQYNFGIMKFLDQCLSEYLKIEEHE